MRITGGVARGIQLLTPASDIRPATDRMREAVFSSLGQRVVSARILDLFAGSGSYGLEAFSRGAESVVFIEKAPKAATALRSNMQSVAKSAGRSITPLQIMQADVLNWLPGQDQNTFDLIFSDPPYPLYSERGNKLWEHLLKIASLSPEAIWVLEMPAESSPPIANWNILKRLGKPSRGSPNIVIAQLQFKFGN